MPKPTPFHSRTAELVESYDWQIWSGYLSPNAYELEHTHEYNAVRTSAGVYDISPLYKYFIDGPDAGALLDRILTREMTKLRVGQVAYTTWCDDDGKIIDDGTVACLDENLYRLTAADPTQRWLEDNTAGLDVHIEDVTERFGGVSVQGPTSRAILQQLVKEDLSGLKYFRLIQTEIAGVPVVLSRTGFTGDLGYEVFVERHNALAIWDSLMEAGESYNLRPMGNLALDMTRIEAGLLLTDVDFISSKKTMFEVQKSTPLELGLGWTVKLDKSYFVGQAALKKEQAKGSKEVTVGLELDLPALEGLYARFGMPLHLPYSSEVESIPVYADARSQRGTGSSARIGKSTSRTWSPVLKKYVGIARVEPRFAGLGTRVYVEMTIEAHRLAVPAKVVEMPFFNPERKRK